MSLVSTRERIIIEAEKQFIAKGILNTQMKDIAEAAAINRRTLYRYFPTKEELAFAIEVEVMQKLQFDLLMEDRDLDGLNGFQKVRLFFDSIRLEGLENLIRYTAEFDSYFRDDYPSESLEKLLVAHTDPENDRLFAFIQEGCKDGSIRSDIPPLELFMFISQNFLGFFQRLILREKHLEKEHCENMDFRKLFKDVILQGIKSGL